MGEFHQVLRSKEEFADKLTGRTVRTVEFGNSDDDQQEIAIHLNDGETMFIGSEFTDRHADEHRLYFASQEMS